MTVVQRIIITMAVFSNIFIPAFSTLAVDETEVNLVLPDEQYVNEECSFLKERANGISSLRRVFQSIDKLCKSYSAGEIDGDQWVEEIAPLGRELEKAYLVQIARRSRVFGGGLNPTAISRNDEHTASPRENDSPRTNTLDPTEQATATTIPDTKPVPKGFSAYTLFLFPSEEWKDKNKQEELKSLRQAFSSFGQAIGDKKVAIWFSERNGSSVDTKRSKDYCDKFNLSYNDGPYVVVTPKRPDEIRRGDKVVIIKLSNITSIRRRQILNVLEQNLRNNQVKPRQLLFEELRQRIFTIAEDFDLKGIVVALIK